MNEFCEICQLKIEKDVLFDHTQNSVICNQCFNQTTDTQQFHQLDVKHEGDIKEPNANFNENTICVKEEPGIENIKEEFNVGSIKEEVCDSQIIKDVEVYYCHDCGCCTDTKQNLIQHIYGQHRKKTPEEADAAAADLTKAIQNAAWTATPDYNSDTIKEKCLMKAFCSD